MKESNNASLIELSIQELALYGFDHINGEELSRVIQHELRGLLSRSKLNRVSKGVNESLASTITLPATAKSEVLGIVISQAIYRNILSQSEFSNLSSRGELNINQSVTSVPNNIGVVSE